MALGGGAEHLGGDDLGRLGRDLQLGREGVRAGPGRDDGAGLGGDDLVVFEAAVGQPG